MRTDQVSILMSVKSTPAILLTRAIRSIIDQTYISWELIIIDDGAPAEQKTVIQNFCRIDSRITSHLNKSNIGLTRSLIRAADLARFDYLARLDADDYWMPTHLSLHMENFSLNPNLVLSGAWYIELSENGAFTHRRTATEHAQIRELMYSSNPFCHSSVVFKNSSYKAVGGYNKYYRTSQDFDLWFKLMHIGTTSIIPAHTTVREINTSCISRSWRRWLQLFYGIQIRLRELSKSFTVKRASAIFLATSKGITLAIFPSIQRLAQRRQ